MPRRGLIQDRRGSVSIIVAFSSTMIMAFAAVAVDLGSIMLQTRKLQGMADLAAIAAARDLDHAQLAAQATAAANGWKGAITTTVVTGTYAVDPAVPSAQRFTGGVAPADAAKVTLSATANLFFLSALTGKTSLPISRRATAAEAKLASFSVGTRLAAVNGGVANALLSALTGSQVNLSVMDYNALASANIDLLQYTQALSTRINAQGLSFENVLASNISSGDALSAFAGVLSTNGDAAGATAMQKLATSAGTSTQANLDDLIDLGPYSDQDHVAGGSGAAVKVNALDMANAVIQAAQQGRQVKVDLGANVAGLASTTLWLAIGQRPTNTPWMTIAKDGSQIVRTSQMRFYIDAKIGAPSLLSGLGVASIELPILVEAAQAQAKLSSIDCGTGGGVLSVAPSVGSLSIAQIDTTKLNDFTQPVATSPANLVSVLLVKATGSAAVTLGGSTWQTVNFSAADISNGVVKTVSTSDLAQATVASLLGNLNLNVTVGGLGLGQGLGLGKSSVVSALTDTLETAAGPLDSLVNGLEDLAGVHLGQADVRLNGVRCRDAALVT